MSGYLQLILAMIIYGSVGIFVTNIPMSSVNIVLSRTIIGGLFILIILLIKKEKIDKDLLKRNMIILILSGAFMGLNWIFLFEAYKYSTVSMATLTYYLAPVLLMLISPIFLKEKLSKNKMLGIGLAMIGMLLVNRAVFGGEDLLKGFTFGILSAIFYTLLMLFNKFLKPGLSGLVITFVQLISAFFVILLFVILSKEPFILPKGAGLLNLLIVCILHTGIACLLYFSSMQKLHAHSIALCSYIDPLSALLFSAMFLNERLSLIQIIGAILILGGAAFGELSSRKLDKIRG